jgi:hypothetical protein
MSYDNLSSVSQNVLKFYQQLSGEERRILFIFDDFHFCRSRVIGLDMTENRIFTLCRMITWVVFLRTFWNFISSLPVKKGGSLSFLVGTICNVLVMEIGCRAPDKLRICIFYAMKTSKNACIFRSECTHYAYILLCKQTFLNSERTYLYSSVHNNTFLSLRNSS